jgi:acetyl-CoA synthetase (ADP-forming)
MTTTTSPLSKPVARRLLPISVSRILYPRSVAVIGASEDLRKFGGRICKAALHHRFQGRFLPVNPGRESIFGVPACRHIAEAGEPVDLAVIAVPAEYLRETVESCGQAGVGACIIITARLEEFNEAGAALQQELVQLARHYNMRLIGPNCMGLINFHHALALSSTATLTGLPALKPGGVGFISQSGGLLGAFLAHAHAHGVGFGSLITVGNQADLELCDFLEALIDDEATTTLCLYVEAFKDASRFRALAWRAHEKDKPLLIVKAGRTQAGQAAVRSHTASLAGSSAAFDALAEATGALVFDEPEGMVLAAGFFDKCRARLPAGNGGISLIGSSGGGAAVLADRLALLGLPLCAWDENTLQRLETHFLPRHIHNPLDLGNFKSQNALNAFTETINAIADNPDTTIVSYLLTPQPRMAETAEALVAAYQRSSKPFLIIADIADYVPEVRKRLTDSGIPIVSRVDDALRIFAAVLRWQSDKAQPRNTAAPDNSPPPALPALPEGPLTEPETKALLRCYGILANREAIASHIESALALADDLGYPVVLKGSSRQVAHKSERGFVRLNIRNAADLRREFDDLARVGAGLADFSILVAKQLENMTEIVLGCRYDAEYGPLVLVGFGGILVEAARDFAVAQAPLTLAQAQALLEKLRLYPLLNGFRGRPRADIDALLEALVNLSRLARDLGPQLLELDINPIMVGAAGQGAVAVDARATLVASIAAPHTNASPSLKTGSHP